jgi:SOUL heme-binding protein
MAVGVNYNPRGLAQACVALALLLTSLSVMAIEEPPFQTLISEPPFEHRRYSGFVVAETAVEGSFDAASRAGFRRVAGYIFGDNTLQNGGSKKIAMTAPVTVEPKEGGWRLHFVMPGSEKLESLPRPNNAEVNLRRVGEHDVVAIQFSGWTTEAAIAEATAKLKSWAQTKQLQIIGSPQVARYNDPFTLPWRRRNEILIEVAR